MNKKAGYAFRIVLGGYLAYLGIRLLLQMVKEKPSNMILMCVVGAIFLIIGGGYAIYCMKKVWDIIKEEKGWGVSEEQSENKTKASTDSAKIRQVNMQATQIKETISGSETAKKTEEQQSFKVEEQRRAEPDEQEQDKQEPDKQEPGGVEQDTEEHGGVEQIIDEQLTKADVKQKEQAGAEVAVDKEEQGNEQPEKEEKNTNEGKSVVFAGDDRVIRIEKESGDDNGQNNQEPAEEIENDYEER